MPDTLPGDFYPEMTGTSTGTSCCCDGVADGDCPCRHIPRVWKVTWFVQTCIGRGFIGDSAECNLCVYDAGTEGIACYGNPGCNGGPSWTVWVPGRRPHSPADFCADPLPPPGDGLTPPDCDALLPGNPYTCVPCCIGLRWCVSCGRDFFTGELVFTAGGIASGIVCPTPGYPTGIVGLGATPLRLEWSCNPFSLTAYDRDTGALLWTAVEWPRAGGSGAAGNALCALFDTACTNYGTAAPEETSGTGIPPTGSSTLTGGTSTGIPVTTGTGGGAG